MKTFKQDVQRDAALVGAGAVGGFAAVCACAMQLSTSTNPEMAGGPDTVTAHGVWIKAQPQEYIATVVQHMIDMKGSL